MQTEPLPGPRRIQIQTQAGCDGRCVFCPNGAVVKAGLPLGRMTPELFQKIVDELAETRPRRIMPYLQNEPLLDARLPDFVRYILDRVPEADTLVTSNGTHLTEAMGEGLIDAGLKRLKVSLQSLDDDTNRRIMGHGAGNVVTNVLAFQRLLKRKRSTMDLRVSMVVTALNVGEVEQARRFWQKQGVRLVTSALENRGGNIANAQELNSGKAMTRFMHCERPCRDMCVLFNGQVILCCVDWFRTFVAGDLSKESIREVWNGARLTRVREGLHTGDDSKLPGICINCTESVSPDDHRRGGWWRQFRKSFSRPFSGVRQLRPARHSGRWM